MTEMNEICYKRNYLTNVIARVDFASPIEGIKEKLPPVIMREAIKYFPIDEPPQSMTTRTVQMGARALSAKDTPFTQWTFHGKDREKNLLIAPHYIHIEYLRYKYFESLKKEFTNILSTFFDKYPDVAAKRLGLRYINEFELPNGDPFDWSNYFRSTLLCTHNFPKDKKSIARAFNILEFNPGDFNLRFQFGMHNPDYPAPIKKRHFIMDFDAYRSGLQEFSEISGNLDKYHDEIQKLFEYAITDKFRNEVLNA